MGHLLKPIRMNKTYNGRYYWNHSSDQDWPEIVQILKEIISEVHGLQHKVQSDRKSRNTASASV